MPFRNSPSNNRWNSLKRNASRGLGSLRGSANRGLNNFQGMLSPKYQRKFSNARQNWRSKYRPALRSKFANARRSLNSRFPSMGRHSSLGRRGVMHKRSGSWFKNLFSGRKSSPVARRSSLSNHVVNPPLTNHVMGGRFHRSGLRRSVGRRF